MTVQYTSDIAAGNFVRLDTKHLERPFIGQLRKWTPTWTQTVFLQIQMRKYLHLRFRPN